MKWLTLAILMASTTTLVAACGAVAAPLVLGKAIAQCQIQPDGPPTSVTVNLNGTTHGFWGPQLYYFFTPTNPNGSVKLFAQPSNGSS